MTAKGPLISHRGHRVIRESRFSHDKQEIAYLALWGVQSRSAGFCMGKALKEKKNAFFFP